MSQCLKNYILVISFLAPVYTLTSSNSGTPIDGQKNQSNTTKKRAHQLITQHDELSPRAKQQAREMDISHLPLVASAPIYAELAEAYLKQAEDSQNVHEKRESYKLAFNWFGRLAQGEHSYNRFARFRMMECYLLGNGVERNAPRAFTFGERLLSQPHDSLTWSVGARLGQMSLLGQAPYFSKNTVLYGKKILLKTAQFSPDATVRQLSQLYLLVAMHLHPDLFYDVHIGEVTALAARDNPRATHSRSEINSLTKVLNLYAEVTSRIPISRERINQMILAVNSIADAPEQVRILANTLLLDIDKKCGAVFMPLSPLPQVTELIWEFIRLVQYHIAGHELFDHFSPQKLSEISSSLLAQRVVPLSAISALDTQKSLLCKRGEIGKLLELMCLIYRDLNPIFGQLQLKNDLVWLINYRNVSGFAVSLLPALRTLIELFESKSAGTTLRDVDSRLQVKLHLCILLNDPNMVVVFADHQQRALRQLDELLADNEVKACAMQITADSLQNFIERFEELTGEEFEEIANLYELMTNLRNSYRELIVPQDPQ